MLTVPDRRTLLLLAREAIARRLAGSEPPACEPSEGLMLRAGAFVTIRRGGALRGCIGFLGASEPLSDVVRRCAVSAAIDDPRFPPISPVELGEAEIEISVLGPREEISGPDEIDVGRHGLIVEHGSYRGLLLPQVATEWKWDAKTFLEQTCLKAGLPPLAWRGGARIWRFEAEVFGEETCSSEDA